MGSAVLSAMEMRLHAFLLRLAPFVMSFIASGCLKYEGENPFDAGRHDGDDPFALAAIPDTDAVLLSWNPLDLKGFEKYVLYKGVSADAPLSVFLELNEGDSTRFVDRAVSPESTYYYRMELVAGGRKSRPSGLASARAIDGGRGVPPGKPVLETTGTTASRITVKWTTNADADFAGYKLFRASTNAVDERDSLVFASVSRQDTVFTDSGLVSLRTYFYRVYSLDKSGLVSGSNSAEASTSARSTFIIKVGNAVTGDLLDGVRLEWLGTSDSCVTDLQGTCRFNNLKAGANPLMATKSGFISSTYSEGSGVRPFDSAAIALRPLPLIRPVGVSEVFTDIQRPLLDDRYVYVVERDWLAPRLVVLNAVTGNEVSSVNLKAVCPELAGSAVLMGSSIYLACPAAKKLIHIRNPAEAGSKPSVLDLPFEPYGVESGQSTIVIAGKAGGDSGMVAVLDTAGDVIARTVALPGFQAEYNSTNTRGPAIALDNDTAFVTNGGSVLGKVAKIRLTDGAILGAANLPWPQISDLVLAGKGVWIGSMNAQAESTLILDRNLSRLPSSSVPGPVRGLAYTNHGAFSGLVVHVSSGTDPDSRSPALSDPDYPLVLAHIGFTEPVLGWSFDASGSRAVAATGKGVYLIEFK